MKDTLTARQDDPISYQYSRLIRIAFKTVNEQTAKVVKHLEQVVDQAQAFELELEQDSNQLQSLVKESLEH